MTAKTSVVLEPSELKKLVQDHIRNTVGVDAREITVRVIDESGDKTRQLPTPIDRMQIVASGVLERHMGLAQ